MAVIINSGTSGDLNPGFGGAGRASSSRAIVRTTSLQVSIGSDTPTDVFSAQVSYGYDQVSGSARIVSATPHGAKGDTVTITMGAGNNVQRFKGVLREFDTTLAPHAIIHLCKGPLYAVEEYENPVETIAVDEGPPGLDFETLVGIGIGSGTGATLRTIVAAVLDRAGVSYNLVNFDNPTQIYGSYAPELFTWRTGETAAAYLHKIFEASAGYRLFDSADGNIYLRQVSGIPSNSADFVLTPGVDVLDKSQANDSSIGQRSAALVQGYDDGSGPASSGVVGTGSLIYRVKSPLIETNALATTLANFWLSVVNRPQRTVRISTYRDDLYGPGQTHVVNNPSSTETLWVKSCIAEITSNGQFSQQTVCVGA